MLNTENNVIYQERSRWLFFGLPLTYTIYTVKEDTVTVKKGLLNTSENDCYMYKIQDVKLNTSLMQRMFGLATLVCYTGDVTDKELVFKNIKNAREIKDYLMKAAEEARLKRRTIHTNNIGAEDIEEVLDEL